MKGSISEFELGILRTRMLDAARAKARRGELRLSVPIGYIWHREYGLGLDPDLRVQEAIRLVFSRFRELGSARQVLISLTADNFHFPRPSDGRKTVSFDWVPVRYRSIISILKNPFYAGVYVYGKSEKRTEIVDGGLAKATATESLLEHGKCCSRIIMKAISIGMSLRGTRAISPSMPSDRKAASSRVVAAARCSRACSPAADVEGDWALSIRGALQVIPTTAGFGNSRTRISVNPGQ